MVQYHDVSDGQIAKLLVRALDRPIFLCPGQATPVLGSTVDSSQSQTGRILSRQTLQTGTSRYFYRATLC